MAKGAAAPAPGLVPVLPDSLLWHRNEFCCLFEQPDSAPLIPESPYGAESFTEWLLRRYFPGTAPEACRTAAGPGRQLVLVPYGVQASAATEPLRAEKNNAGWKLSHSLLGGELSLAPPVPGHRLMPVWLDPKDTVIHRCLGGDRSRGARPVVERLGDYALGSFDRSPKASELEWLAACAERMNRSGCYWRVTAPKEEATLGERRDWHHLFGSAMPDDYPVRESGITYLVGLSEGRSYGFFPDQRENRLRLLQNRLAPGFPAFAPNDAAPPRLLNAFAYTCSFSVGAAAAGARTVNVDLSRKYLDWGRRNFAANGLPLEPHEFLHGDIFGWIRRFRKRKNRFEAIVLDPPTFSRSRESGVFRVERDLPELARQAVELLTPGGRMLVASNRAAWSPAAFTRSLEQAVARTGRRIVRRLFVTQPWDYPPDDQGRRYLKSWWFAFD